MQSAGDYWLSLWRGYLRFITHNQVIAGRAALPAFLFLSLIAFAGAAHADLYDPPPLPSIVDENGINLQSGEFQVQGPSVSVGQPGQGGLTYSPTSVHTGNWVSNFGGDSNTIKYDPADPNTLMVTYQNNTTTFTSFVNETGDGASLSHSGSNYIFTAHDGTVVVFQDVTSTYSCNYYDIWCTAGLISSATYPTGEVITYTYATSGGVPTGDLSSVNSSLGYQLKFNFVYSCPTCYSYSVTAVNNAVTYCDPSGTTCPGTWPTTNYTLSGGFGHPATGTITDALGNATVNSEYYSSTVLYQQTITQPSGRYIRRTVENCTDGCDLKEAVTDGSGASWDYEITNSSGVVTTRITDPVGRVKVVVSDATTGLISSTTNDPSGLNLTTTYTWNLPGQPFQITYPEGNYDQWNYDSRSNNTGIDHVAKPGSGTATVSTHMTYDTCTSTNRLHCNKPVTVTDANGNVTTNVYDDSSGEIVSSTGPTVGAGTASATYTYSPLYAWFYNSSGSIVSAPAPVYKPISTSKCLQNSNGAVWGSVNWGSFNWSAPPCTGTAQQQVTTIGYTAGSSGTATNLLPVSTTVAAGDGSISSTTSVSYDAYSNVVSSTGPISGSTSVSFYDLDRRQYGSVSPDPTGSGAYPAVRTSYDVDSRVTEVERGTTNGQGISNWSSFSSLTQVTTGYNTYTGLKASDTSAIGGATQSVTQYSYDGSRLPLCTAVRQNPSIFGSLPSDACTLSTTGSFGPDQISHNSYDSLSRLTSVQTGYATGSAITPVTNSYTANSKLSYVEDGNGNRTAYTYDGLDRLVQTNFPSTTTPHTPNSSDYETYLYDGNGNLTQKRLRTSETMTYQYDALNRQTQIDFPSGGSSNIYMSYDLIGDLLYAHYGSATGSGMEYVYDAFGRKLSETSYGRMVSSQYDAAGNRTRLTYPDGNYIQYTYDILNRMSQVKQNGSTALAQYSYDSLDRETGITRSSNPAITSMSYSGSSTSWSLSQTGMTQSVTFAMNYTPAGQVYQRTISNSAYAYSAPSLSNSYSSNGLNEYSSVGGAGYGYDGRGNLTSNSARGLNYDLQNHLTSNSFSSPSVALAYDPAGRLNQETVVSTTEQFLYDGNNLIAEYDSSGNLLRRFVPGQNADETVVWYEGSGLSTPNWLHTDQQGSVVATTNSSGTATTYTYSATGEPASWSGPRFRYTGQVAIPELALYYYKARMYDPGLGRFLQTDPAGYSDDLNLYAYVHNDPANGADSLGLASDFNCLPPNCEPVTINGIGSSPWGMFYGIGDFFSQFQESARESLKKLPRLSGTNGFRAKYCSVVPSGRVGSVAATAGGIGSAIFSAEEVVNYNSGLTSLFGTTGGSAGANFGGSVTVGAGFVWGLDATNNGFSGPFKGVSASGTIPDIPFSTVGGSITSGGGVTVASVNAGVSAGAFRYSGGVTVTGTSAPLNAGYFTGYNSLDYLGYLARRPCN